MTTKGKVLVGMSGGVDSSVAAALLLEQGYDCIGVYMNLWADPTLFELEDKKKFPQNKCCSIESLMFARSICQSLGMPFYSVNFEEAFKENVVDYFLEQVREGETPNPCVRCNKTIKFGVFFKKMEELGCDFLATGHYAQLQTLPSGEVQLLRGKDDSKDQTYFLYNLTQEKLKKLLFPLGAYDKTEVRALAKKFQLKELENKKESQGVCFYPEKSYMPFLQRYLKPQKDFKKGDVLNTKGKKIGEHDGLPFYTIGQRKGIGVGGPNGILYVNKMDTLKNTLIVGNEEELFSKSVTLRETNFLSGKSPKEGTEFDIKIRSHGTYSKGKFHEKDGLITVEFTQPQRAVMAGQSLVFYDGKQVIGGGIMTW